eukprot:TRINITY_DN30359_c0_g1_i2.p1 TRINITY_DN30359_c0_g1~~TRINITY_DN30359_c0_g1_i2.p1  ORF type:complete len:172 (-),score=38.32 TRINITY_DN30359_c0_g1_i2:431-946(-)
MVLKPGQEECGEGVEVRPVSPGEVVCLSNGQSEESNATWPKVCWVKAQVEALLAELRAEDAGESSGSEGFDLLLDRLSQIMSTTNSFGEEEMPDLSFTPYQEAECRLEKHLQCGPFIPFNEDFPDYGGTMMQTIVAYSKAGGCVFHGWRKSMGDATAGAWSISQHPYKSNL